MSDCGDVKKVFVPAHTETHTEIMPENIYALQGINITVKAALKIIDFIQQAHHSLTDYGLRIAVRKDGCSGLSYDMDLAQITPHETNGDKVFQCPNGATVIIEKLSYLYVIGSTLNYTEALTGSGFVLTNPNVKKTCSCGSSFAV